MNFTADAGKEGDNVIFQLAGNKANGTNALVSNSAPSGSGVTNDLVRYSVTADGNGITSEAVATAIMDSINKNGKGDGIVYLRSDGGNYIQNKVTQDGDNLNFEMTNDGYNTAVSLYNAKTNDDKTVFRGNFNFGAAGSDTDTGADATTTGFVDTVSNIQHIASNDVHIGSPAAGTTPAELVIHFGDGSVASTLNSGEKVDNKITDFIRDSAGGIQIGDEAYIWAASDELLNATYASNVKVEDIRGLDFDATTNPAGASADLTKALANFSQAAKDDAMFDVQVGRGNECLILTERITYSGDADLTKTGLMKQIQTFSGTTTTTTVDKKADDEYWYSLHRPCLHRQIMYRRARCNCLANDRFIHISRIKKGRASARPWLLRV